MISTRGIARLASGYKLPTLPLKFGAPSFRTYSTEVAKKKKKRTVADISQVPIKNIGVIADFYIPPNIFKGPIKSWPKLLLRKIGVIAINTVSIAKYKKETKLNLAFNDWKELAMEKFVHTNKIFAAACSKPVSQRKAYLDAQLEDVAGAQVVKSLNNRAESFPPGTKLSWELISIESNPKVVSFSALPDAEDMTAYIQFVMKVKTKQKLTISSGKDSSSTERIVSDNLVYTLNPYSDELVLAGTVFDSNYVRGLQPELNFNNAQVMTAYQNKCADIYRAPPSLEAKKD